MESAVDIAVLASANEIQITHFIPGRVRFKIERLKQDRIMAGIVRQVIASVTGVTGVEVNSTTGSVLVLYEPSILRWDDPNLRAIAPGLFPENISTDMCEDWLRMRMCGAGSNTDLSAQIESAAAVLNQRVGAATGGAADLRTLLPLALVAMGIGTIVVSRRLPMPKWYDFFWFALGTYSIFRELGRSKS